MSDSVVKSPPAKEGDARDSGLIPESARSPGGGHGNLLHYSCLGNSMDRGAWWATVHERFGTQAYSEVIEPYFFSGDFLEAPVSYSPRKSCSKFLRRMISFILEKIFFHD